MQQQSNLKEALTADEESGDPNAYSNDAGKEEQTDWLFYASSLKRTLPTILSYDNDINLPLLGIMITHLGHGQAAPAITSLLNTVSFLQFSCVQPASFLLGKLSGQLAATELDISQSSDPEEQLALAEKAKELSRQIERVPKNGVIAGLTCLPAIFCMLCSSPLLLALGQSKDVADSAETFFGPFTPFFLAFSPRLVLEFILLSMEKQNGAMTIALVSLMITVALEYNLAFETSMRLSGLGLAAGVGTVLTAMGFLAYVENSFREFNFVKSSFSWSSEDGKEICDMVKESFPIAVTGVSEASVALAISLLAGHLSKESLKRQNVATQLLNINALITAASSQTVSLMVSEQRGKAKENKVAYESIKQATWAGIYATLSIQLPLMLFASGGSSLFSKMIGETFAAREIWLLIALSSIYGCIDGGRLNILQSTRSIGDSALPSFISAACLWSGVGLSYYFSQHTNLKELGLPLGILMGSFVGSLILNGRLDKSIAMAKAKDEELSSEVGEKEALITPPETKASMLGGWCSYFQNGTRTNDDVSHHLQQRSGANLG